MNAIALPRDLETRAAALPAPPADDADDPVAEALGVLTSETRAALDRIAGDVGELRTRQDQIELRANRPGAGGWGNAELADECRAIAGFARSGDDRELREMSVGDDPGGGYMVLPHYSTAIQGKLKDGVAMRRLARIETITSGDAWEEVWDNEDAGAEWVGETSGRPATSSPTPVRLLRVPLCEIYAHQVLTQKLLDTAFTDLGQWIEGKIGDKFSRKEGADFVTGDGVIRPRGLMTYPTSAADDDTRPWHTLQFVAGGHATAITADGLRALYWKVRAPYRTNATWLMSSATASAVDSLKDLNGQYLWRPAMTAETAPTLLGRPVEFDESMPGIAADALPVAFGDFRRAYLIVDLSGAKFLRDPYTNKPNVVFYAYKRVGGGLADSEAVKLLKIATP